VLYPVPSVPDCPRRDVQGGWPAFAAEEAAGGEGSLGFALPGAWTVVETYERDGERYLVARRRGSRPGPRALSPREHQALRVALLGETNKVIAFEMGISASTVGVLIHRARQKLGCRTRAELLARFQELSWESPHGDAPLP
jgi:DNA-binding CsgD family transcriptional regulator